MKPQTTEEKIARHREHIARYTQYAENATKRSEAAYSRATGIASMVPMGQPILVGHHSEGRARRDQGRIHSGMKKCLEEEGKAKYYEHKIRWHEMWIGRLERTIKTAAETKQESRDHFLARHQVGDRVFDPIRRMEGTIRKINIKTVRIEFDDGVDWIQPMHFLT